MKKLLDELTYGAECAIRGTGIFFTRPRLWPYAVPPLLCVLLLYALIFFAVLLWIVPGLHAWAQGISFPGWLSWLQSVLDWCLKLFFWVIVPLLLLLLTGSFYEMFGNMLFDILVDRFEKEAYPDHPGADQPYGHVVRLTAGYILLTVKGYLVWFLIFWVPVVGFLFRRAICGRSYLHDSAIRQGLPVSVLKRQVAKHRPAVLGFGIVACLMESLPFLIPGLVIGGAILYHTRLFDGTGKPSEVPESAKSGGMERRA